MISMGMMQMTIYQIIRMLTVRNCLNKVTNFVRKHEHAEPASDLEGSLNTCKLSQQQAQYSLSRWRRKMCC